MSGPRTEQKASPNHSAGRRGRFSHAARFVSLSCLAIVGFTLLFGTTAAWAANAPVMYGNASPSTTVGLLVFDHVNLSGPITPTGTLSFALYAPGDTTCASPVFTTSLTVSGTGSDDSSKWKTTSAGTYNWVASYSGDANYLPLSTPCGDPAQAVFVGKARTSAAITPQFSGGALHATAVISGGFAPLSGTITFYLTGPNDQFCSGTPAFTQTIPVNGAGTYNSAPFTPTAAGDYIYRVRYSGDKNSFASGPTQCLDPAALITITAAQLTQSAFTYPTSGGTKDTATPFSWNAQPGAEKYALFVGTSVASPDLMSAYLSPGTLSYDAPSSLPVGTTLYARLWTMTNGVWSSYQDITFTAIDGATFTSPGNGQSQVAPAPLSWSSVNHAQQYALWVGTKPGGYDLLGRGFQAGTTAYDMGALPVGIRIYARVWTMMNGSWSRYQDISFTAGQGATFSNLSDGQTNVNPASPFSWTAVAAADEYSVWVGTTRGGYDVASAWLPAGTTSFAPVGIPSGRTLYARVWTSVNGVWVRYQDVSFTTQ